MAPPKGKGAAARSNPSAPSLPEEPLDDDNGTSYTPDLEDELARLREALAAAQDRIVALEQGNPLPLSPLLPRLLLLLFLLPRLLLLLFPLLLRLLLSLLPLSLLLPLLPALPPR